MAPSSSRPSSAAGCPRPRESATDTDVRRAMDICVDNANRAIFNAANSNPQYAGMGTTLVVGVFRDNRLLLGHVGDSRCYRLRGRPAAADHARPLAAAGADRRRPDHRRAGRVLGQQEPGDARGRRRGHRAARDPPARRACRATSTCCAPTGCRTCSTTRRIAQLLQSCDLLPEAATALIDAANDAGGKDNISVVLVAGERPGAGRALLVAVPALIRAGTAARRRLAGLAHRDKRLEVESMGKLVVSLDGVVIKEVQITKDKTTLGRRPYNDIVIDNLAVSGEHAVLQMVGPTSSSKTSTAPTAPTSTARPSRSSCWRTTTRSRSASTRSSSWSTTAPTTRRR